MATWNLIPPAEWLETEAQIIEASNYLQHEGAVDASTGMRKLGFDTETTGLHYTRDYPLILSLSDGIRRFAAEWEPWGRHPAIKDELLENPRILNILTNAKFDMHMIGNRGVQLLGDTRCTLIMDWLFDENRWNHDLKTTAREHCGIKMLDFKQVFPMHKKKKGRPDDTAGAAIKRVMADPEGRQRAIEYAGLDAFASVKVHDFLEDRLKRDFLYDDYSYWQYFLDWEVEFTRTLFNMERRGFKLATGHLRAQIGPMEEDIEELNGQIAHLCGHPINPNSPKQLAKLFFEELGRTPIKYTKGGKTGIKSPSTDAEVMDRFAEDGCPYAQLIVDIRNLVKTKGTYIETPLELVDDNLRIHTQLKQHGTVTGRLSSKEPNLQNLPRPGGDSYRIREAFVAEPGKILLVRDYEQLEMRIMAHFSQDPRMIQAIRDGLDLHCYTVSLMYGVEYSEVAAAKKKSKDELTERDIMLLGYRQAAKATGFGLIYGIGAKKLGLGLGKELGREYSVKESKALIRSYFDIFTGVEAFIKGTHKACKQDEFVRTLLGRKRRLPMINAGGGRRSKDGDDVNTSGIAAMAQRQSVNSIVQGSAADIAKAAMLKCEADQELKTLGSEMLMQVHDELIFEVWDTPEHRALTDKRVKQIMENPFGDFQLSVPIPTSGDFAYTWADAK